MAEDNSWITETLVQFTRSPVWRTPVNDFIDDNCEVFDNDEEMKLEYTTIHNQFKTLVDGLLTNFVQELGVPLEDALAAVKATLADHNSEGYKPINRLLKLVYMAEDFQTFHRAMVRRNIELDILATQALQACGIDLSGGDPAAMNERLREVQLSDADHRLAVAANGDLDEETALRNAITASLEEQGMESKKLELEDAELREALALSIQAEEERARQSAEKVEEEVQQVRKRDIAAAERIRKEKLGKIEEQKALTIEKLTAHNIEALKENEKKRKVIKGREMSAPSSPFKEDQPPKAKAQEPPTPPPLASAPAKRAPGALPPIGGSSSSGPAALPPIQAGGPLRPLVVDSNAGAQPTPAEEGSSKPPASSQSSSKKPSKEELEARAKHMKEQRARILAQNKASRQHELSKCASESGTSAPGGTDGASNTTAAQKQLTVDIARRLREDMVREATKKA